MTIPAVKEKVVSPTSLQDIDKTKKLSMMMANMRGEKRKQRPENKEIRSSTFSNTSPTK
jgi:hypothetical protein